MNIEDFHGCLRDPERPYPFFPGGRPAPLREGIVFTELCGSCPMQAKGTATERDFTFWARHGRWKFQIEGACHQEPQNFSGDDRWAGHMPPSVAFAMVVSKLLWHVCGQDFGSPPPGSRSLIRSADRECLEQANLLIGELDAVLKALLDPHAFPPIGLSGTGPRVMQIFLSPGAIRDPSRMEARHPGLKIKAQAEKPRVRQDITHAQEIARDQSYGDWRGLRAMSDLFIVRLTHWLAGQDPSDYSESTREMLNAVLWESKGRGWEEDWWEDPSVVLEAR